MKLEIIQTPLAEKMSVESSGFSRADTEKAERLLKSTKSTMTNRLIHQILKSHGEISEVTSKWDTNEDCTHLVIFQSFNIEDASSDVYEKINKSVDRLINDFPYYLHSCERLSFSKPITPLIVNHETLNNLDAEIKFFIEKFLYEAIEAKGTIALTGFFEDLNIDFNNLRVGFKETNDAGVDPNFVYTTRGKVIDFNYDERQFTLLEQTDEGITPDEKGTKIKFRFSEDEILNAHQEAYFHRYCVEPSPVITVCYLKLSSGNYVRLDLMKEMRVGFENEEQTDNHYSGVLTIQKTY